MVFHQQIKVGIVSATCNSFLAVVYKVLHVAHELIVCSHPLAMLMDRQYGTTVVLLPRLTALADSLLMYGMSHAELYFPATEHYHPLTGSKLCSLVAGSQV